MAKTSKRRPLENGPKFGPKYKCFKIACLEFFFWKYYFGNTTFLYSSTRSSDITRVFFNFRFSSRKFQSQQKLPKKIIHFTMQFRSINLSHFMNFNSLEIENNMLPQRSKTFLTLQIFQQILSCLVSEKTFALHHFLMPKNYILEALCLCLYVYIFLYISVR